MTVAGELPANVGSPLYEDLLRKTPGFSSCLCGLSVALEQCR